MEANVDLDLTTGIHVNSNGKVFVEALVSDNDSTMRILLQHKENNPKDKLSSVIP